MKNCVFCDIASGKIQAHKIYEDMKYIAILDIHPNTSGQTLIITKKHYPSYVFKMNERKYLDLMKVSKKIAILLDNKLKVKRTAMVMEGMGIDHAHIKLYPLHGLNKEFKEIWAKKRIFFDKYKGYITTLMGPEIKKEHLKKISKKIRG